MGQQCVCQHHVMNERLGRSLLSILTTYFKQRVSKVASLHNLKLNNSNRIDYFLTSIVLSSQTLCLLPPWIFYSSSIVEECLLVLILIMEIIHMLNYELHLFLRLCFFFFFSSSLTHSPFFLGSSSSQG